MRKEVITIGTQFNTVSGYEVVTGYNGSIIFTDTFELDEETYGTTDEYVKTREGRYTLEEVGLAMREVDGLNRRVTFQA